MAAEVPAKEVLCEAMEYLSKLGSNLRTRSENLKEKKIRREKLNNVLAVQKAASKVLLICELSKKSLENVETGVRKVLELIDTSQASSSNGGKKSQTQSDEADKPKYYYFEYKSRTLRIKNRISFKHYNSLRVHAKLLPKHVIDKYPVHYDCKLYRMRKKHRDLEELKAEFKNKIVEENSIDASIISIPDTPVSKSVIEKDKKKEDKNQNNVMSIISVPDSPEPILGEDKRNIDKSPTENERRMSTVESTKEKSTSRDHQSPGKKSDESEKRSSREDYSKKRSSDKNEEQKQSLKRKRIVYDSSSDDDEKNAGVDSEKKENVLAIKDDDNEVSVYESESKKLKLDNENNDVQLLGEEDTAENDQNEPAKPVIKCVSLSKLLKPDVLEKEITGPHSKPKDSKGEKREEPRPDVLEKKIIGPHSKPKDSEAKKREQLRQIEKQAKQEKEEEEYWSQKRKEVISFKPRNFVINVTRLPELSVHYLKQLGFKKISQDGGTICEIAVLNSDEPDAELRDGGEARKSKKNKNKPRSDESKSNSRRASKSSSECDDAIKNDKVKNSLLNEFDLDDAIGSDKEFKLSEKDTENIKSALLNDSDSETKKSDNESQSSDSDKADKESASETDKAKKALFRDSDSESDKSEPIFDNTATKKDDVAPSNLIDVDTGSLQLTFDVDSDSEQREASDENDTAAAKHISDGSHSDNENDKNTNGNDSDDLGKEDDENISKCQENEKTPEKQDADKAKSSLLSESSDDKTKTPLNKRLIPQSKKKRLRESIHAKKMLLTHSSSDTEDEQLRDALKDIKDSLLQGSDEDNKKIRQSKESSPSSGEEVIEKVKKKKSYNSSSKERHKYKRKKHHRRRLDSDNSSKNSDNSKSSSSKMVRSKSKPGNSSSQLSDTPDSNDKDIDGLTNLNTLSKPRRRNSNSSDMSDSSSIEEGKAKKSSKLKIKPTGLIAEDMLKAESSSDSAEASAEENDDGEDLTAVTLPSINGGGEHLVKEDLLGESDSSASHHEDDKSAKEESDSEDKPNAKRRKANAISSDSEVGSSRKKDASVKLSDFEDSDDSDINKRSKRKKKVTDSDASAGGSSNEGGKKKRRRIKSLRDSEGSGSESETEGRNKHGRKNIRKVMGKNQLEEATKKAAREEKERIARIVERQKMYNNLEFDESGKPDEVVLDKVILDFDTETKEPLIEVDRGLVKKLKPHQANGIKFMWNACFESVKRIKKDKGSGCILAHCMGLGKTLQVVSLTHTLLIHSDLTTVNRVLVVCPLSTVLNWVNEFRMWLKFSETEFDVEVYELSRYKQNSERAFQLSQWFRHGGVCVLGYEMFRNLSADNSKKFKKKMLKNFQEALVDPGPDLVVCDEGHLLKNEKTSLSQSMNRVRTLRRIVLTGTPLQNNLKEYYCMVQFVKPNLLGKYNEYLNRFVNPITNGQYTDSTEHDIKIMKRRSHVLHKMLDGSVQRRDYGVLAPFLPPKHEYVLFITLSDVQVKLYQHYLDNFSRKPLPGKSSGFLFPDFQSLQRIWTHPLVLKYNSERYEIMQQKKRDKEEEEGIDSEGSLRDFIDDDSSPEDTSSEDSTDDSSDDSDDSTKKNKKKKKAAKKAKGKDKDKDKEGRGDGGPTRPRRGTRANPVEHEEEDVDELIEIKNENPTEWWIKLVTEDEVEDMRHSHKLVLLFDILRQCEAIGDKLLVFSQSLYSLDLIEHFLGKVDDATQEGRIDEKLGGHIGTWSPGIDYFRLDGSTSCENRSIWCKNFNREDNPRARLFLISTRAGGLGINLVAANRVVIFDVSWNPSHDVQSIFRVYRFGQKKPCYVYRFLAMGTMEEKIYERQVTKQAISKRVIDEQQIDRHYAENDLAELYKFEPQPPSPRPIPPLPKDRLFAEMLREHEAQIYKYHEHDSLLENKEEETLSEEERKAAWEDFENEKNRPPPAPFPNTWQMPNLLQQQQLAYAALAAMLRKDMPNLSDNQLRDMLPIIYNSNPQLMQKLSDIYKYSPGLMNPAMMNPAVMNPAAGVGLGGVGGASGLQYEPPWQRQQQQQQHMRLQQLLQHQNQMGAKFYAGGLGSRDPVAMALQQQRAREIMLGNVAGGAGRPRGRPPMQPLAPPPGDVVNLDSD